MITMEIPKNNNGLHSTKQTITLKYRWELKNCEHGSKIRLVVVKKGRLRGGKEERWRGREEDKREDGEDERR